MRLKEFCHSSRGSFQRNAENLSSRGDFLWKPETPRVLNPKSISAGVRPNSFFRLGQMKIWREAKVFDASKYLFSLNIFRAQYLCLNINQQVRRVSLQFLSNLLSSVRDDFPKRGIRHAQILLHF